MSCRYSWQKQGRLVCAIGFLYLSNRSALPSGPSQRIFKFFRAAGRDLELSSGRPWDSCHGEEHRPEAAAVREIPTRGRIHALSKAYHLEWSQADCQNHIAAVKLMTNSLSGSSSPNLQVDPWLTSTCLRPQWMLCAIRRHDTISCCQHLCLVADLQVK